jgi:hypothetical protein
MLETSIFTGLIGLLLIFFPEKHNKLYIKWYALFGLKVSGKILKNPNFTRGFGLLLLSIALLIMFFEL